MLDTTVALEQLPQDPRMETQATYVLSAFSAPLALQFLALALMARER